MGLKYWRSGVVALTTGLIFSIAGAGAVLAGDPPADGIVFDGVVRVHWVDRVDGVVGGATIRIFFYREGDPFPGILPGAITNSRGVAVITGVPRSIDPADPVFLDIDGRLATSTLGDDGCTTFQRWNAHRLGFKSRLRAVVLLQTNFRSDPEVNCPEPPTMEVVEPAHQAIGLGSQTARISPR